MSGPDPELDAWLRSEAERPLSAEEFAARTAAPMSEAERAEALDLIRWFTTRYPTAAQRLAYVRQAHARWTARR
jgi:hypothetical protein